MSKSKLKSGASALPNQLEALAQRLGPIEYRPLSSLTAYENNPRKHPEKQLVKLEASMREFGFAMPVLVDEASVIIAGEARVMAAKRLGMTEVPVIVAHHWSASQIKAYRLADNRLAELSHFDTETLAIEIAAIIELDETPIEVMGWDTGGIDVILQEAGEEDKSSDPADAQMALPSNPTSRLGDIWNLGKHRLLCGSSLEAENWVRLMDGETAAMVFADMPYNTRVDGHVGGLGKIKHQEFQFASGEMTRAEFTAFMTDAIGRMADPLKDGGVLTLAMDWRSSLEILTAIEANDLSVLNMCVWLKSSGGMGSLYRSQHELFWIAKKGKAPHTNCVELGKHGRYRTNCWSHPGVNSFGKTRMQDLADHPTVKPTALVADAIRDVTHPGEIVIDGFMGSGTTILAAERTKRRGFGVEIEPKYVDVAIRRWESMTGEHALLQNTGQTLAEVTEARAAEASVTDEAEPALTNS